MISSPAAGAGEGSGSMISSPYWGDGRRRRGYGPPGRCSGRPGHLDATVVDVQTAAHLEDGVHVPGNQAGRAGRDGGDVNLAGLAGRIRDDPAARDLTQARHQGLQVADIIGIRRHVSVANSEVMARAEDGILS
jgi:hypothetical protein